MCSHLCPCVIGSAVSHANDPTPLLLEFFLALAFPGLASGVARPAPCPQVSWVWAEYVVVDAEFQVHQKFSVSHFLRFFFEDWLCWLTSHCRGAFYLEFDIYQPRYDIPKTCTDSKVYLDRFSAFWLRSNVPKPILNLSRTFMSGIWSKVHLKSYMWK